MKDLMNKVVSKRFFLLNAAFVTIVAGMLTSTTITTIGDIMLLLSWVLFGVAKTGNLRGISLSVRDFFRKKEYLYFTFFYILSVVGLLYSSNTEQGIRELTVKMPLLLFPVIFAGLPAIEKRTLKLVIIVHCMVLLAATVIIVINFAGGSDNFRKYYPFISHIRLSLNYCLSILMLLYILVQKRHVLSIKTKMAIIVVMSIFIMSLMILKSITGIGTLVFAAVILMVTDKNLANGGRKMQVAMKTLAAMIFLVSVGYLVYSYNRYYRMDVDIANLPATTVNGNAYVNDVAGSLLEEGNYDKCLLCEDELSSQWNKVSAVKYDMPASNPDSTMIRDVLIRYMTSLGLAKDSVGITKLTIKQIDEIERGIPNAYYSKFGLYPRISSTFITFERLKKTGDPSGGSVVQRIASWITSLHLIGKKPLFGYGTGEVVDVHRRGYATYYPKLQEEFKIPPHNQYLFNTLQSGIVGLLIFLFSIVAPGIITGKFGDYFFKLIFIVAAISMFFEDTIGSQIGITFVCFFYFLFMKRR